MAIGSAITCALLLLLQTVGPSSFPEGTFNAKEKVRLEQENKIEGRIKVYTAVAKRMSQEMEAAVRKDNQEVMPGKLRLWASLLSRSLEDIQANLKSKKKSRALIRYEIQVRKSIAEIQRFKTRIPVEQQDLLDSSLSEAEKVRKSFVQILFRH